MYYVIHVMIVNLYGTGDSRAGRTFCMLLFESVHMIKNLC